MWKEGKERDAPTQTVMHLGRPRTSFEGKVATLWPVQTSVLKGFLDFTSNKLDFTSNKQGGSLRLEGF